LRDGDFSAAIAHKVAVSESFKCI